MNLPLKKILLAILLAPAFTYAEAGDIVKVKNAKGQWEVSNEITMAQAEEKAFLEAKKEALRKAGVMENVWSVFGQITSEKGSKFDEAFSSVSVLAVNGLVNVTEKKTEDLWDPVAKKLFKIVTINANVMKSEIPEDKSYVLQVEGIEPIYKESELFSCTLKVSGHDSYIKFFWFGEDGASLIYPNEYEGDMLLKAGKKYSFPLSGKVDMAMEKIDSSAEYEKVNIIVVATKKNFPYTGNSDYQSILTWIFNLPADQRALFYNMTLIK